MTTVQMDWYRWAEDVAGLLATMPQRSAAALRLSYFEQLPEHEIAARLGTSLVEARTALASGLRILGRAVSTRPPA